MLFRSVFGRTVLKVSISYLFSHDWFAMPHEVLQADWHDVWHSPHPPFAALSFGLLVAIVLIPFIFIPPFVKNPYITHKLYEIFVPKAKGMRPL